MLSSFFPLIQYNLIIMDKISEKHRSWNMSRIKSKNTKPEMRVRSMLHLMGYRFRLHDKNLPGKPDIILKKYNTIIFVHGCFWHRHFGCKYTYTPRTKIVFWENKFKINQKRDIENINLLQELGWNVRIIWSCETQNEELLRNKIINLMMF